MTQTWFAAAFGATVMIPDVNIDFLISERILMISWVSVSWDTSTWVMSLVLPDILTCFRIVSRQCFGGASDTSKKLVKLCRFSPPLLNVSWRLKSQELEESREHSGQKTACG